MLLRTRFQPRTIFRFAMGALICFFSMPILSRSMTGVSTDVLDGIRGAFFGIAVGLLIVFKVMQRKSAARP